MLDQKNGSLVSERKDRSESHIEGTIATIEISKGQKQKKHNKDIETLPALSTAGFEEQGKLRQEKV